MLLVSVGQSDNSVCPIQHPHPANKNIQERNL